MNNTRLVHLCLLTQLTNQAVLFCTACERQTVNIKEPPSQRLLMQRRSTPFKDGTVRFLLRPAEMPQPHEEGTFVDERNAWISSGGKLLRTTDGGRSWQEIYLSAEHASVFGELGSMYVKVNFVTPLLGWLMADSGIWQTSDGGTMWQLISTDLYDVFYFVGEQHGWMNLAEKGGQQSYITQDGGHSWQLCGSARKGDSQLPRQAYFLTAQKGWAITSQTDKDRHTTYGIARTSDGGCHWQQVWINDEYPDERLSDLIFINERDGWLAGERRLYHTMDGGKVWRDVPLLTGEMQLSSVYFADSNNGWVIAAPKTNDATGIYHTTDGGKRWQQLSMNKLARDGNGEIPAKWKAGKLLQMLYANRHNNQ